MDIILTVEKTVRREKRFFFAYFLFRKKVKLVLIRARVHPFPFRTRKLSSLLPKILAWRRAGKIGNANTNGQFRLTVFSCQVRQPKELEKSSKDSKKFLTRRTEYGILNKSLARATVIKLQGPGG